MAYFATGTGVTGTATGASVPVPASVVAGHIVTIGLYLETTDATITWPAGFTQKFDSGTANATTRGRLLTAWKRLTGSDTGTYSVTWTTSVVYEAVAIAHSGIVYTGDPFESNGNGVSTSSTATNVNITPYDALFHSDAIGFGTNHASNSGGFTEPSTWDERYDGGAGGVRHLGAWTKDTVPPTASHAPVPTTSGTTGGSYPRAWVGSLRSDAVIIRNTTTGAPGSAASFTITNPTHETGDRLVLFVGGKDETTTAPTIDNSWVQTMFVTGGTGSTAADTGQCFMAVYEKIATSSSETNPTVTAGATAPNSWAWICHSFRPSAGYAWRDALAASPGYIVTGADTTTGDSVLTASGTFTDQPTTGDAIIAAGAFPTDQGASTASTSTLTNGGWTNLLALAYARSFIDNGLGLDMGMGTIAAQSFAGTATGATSSSLVFTSSPNHSGVTAIVALRQILIVNGTVTLTAPMTGSGLFLPPVVTGEAGSTDGTVNLTGPMTASGLMLPPVPGVTTETPAATGSGTMPAPTVTAGSSVAAATATGSGLFLPPTVTAEAFVSGVAATASGLFLPPTVTAEASAEVVAVVMTASGLFLPPEVQTTGEGEVITVSMTGSGQMLAPTVTASSTVQAVPATGSGQMPTPVVSAGATITAVASTGSGLMVPPTITATAVVGAVVMVGTADMVNMTLSVSSVVQPPVMNGSGEMIPPPAFLDLNAPPTEERTWFVRGERRSWQPKSEGRRYLVATSRRVFEVE